MWQLFRWAGFACLMALVLAHPTSAQPNIPTCDPDAPLSNGAPSTSPDGRYTVWISCYRPNAAFYLVTAYDAEADETYSLGQITDTRRGVTGDGITTAFVGRWLTDETVEFRAETGGGTYNWRFVFLADASTPGSLASVAADYISRPRFSPDPDRYEWVVEDGIVATYQVVVYDVATADYEVLYTDACELRDDRNEPQSCHMTTAHTNASFTEAGQPSAVALTGGDSAREYKQIEVRQLPEGELIYETETLGSGYAEWVAADTVAVYDLDFDFRETAFVGVFLRVGPDGMILEQESFSLLSTAERAANPSWMATE